MQAQTLDDTSLRDVPGFLHALFARAVEVADPMKCVPAALPTRPAGRVCVVGAGKASARMAEALEAEWGPCEGLVITRCGYARPCRGVEIVEAAHPVPDKAGLDATARMLRLVDGLDDDCVVVALVSGGGSSLLVQPAGAITLDEKQAVNAALLASGAPIGEMNIVRKHLSRVKGGQLATAAWPARLLSLIISDVPGDDLALIASGPTVADRTTKADARAILDRYQINVPPSVAAVLAGDEHLPDIGDRRLDRTEERLIAAPSRSLEAAAQLAVKAGCRVKILGDALEGEARDLAVDHARLAIEIQQNIGPSDPPVLILSGGECTVTRRGDGVGGPNAEFALAMALELNGAPGIWALACDTDGVDGAAEVAGALIGPDLLGRARAAGLDAAAMLDRNDSHGFFAATSARVVTGPTLTNVNDFRAILVTYAGAGGAE